MRGNVLANEVEVDRIKNVTVPGYFGAFQKGYRISPSEVNDAMHFLTTVHNTWDHIGLEFVPAGIVLEHLRDVDEIKVFVMLGKVVGHYYMAGGGFDHPQVHALAEAAARAAGIDFVRIDIIKYRGRYCISEFTINPDIFGQGRRIVEQNFDQLVKFHTSRKAGTIIIR